MAAEAAFSALLPPEEGGWARGQDREMRQMSRTKLVAGRQSEKRQEVTGKAFSPGHLRQNLPVLNMSLHIPQSCGQHAGSQPPLLNALRSMSSLLEAHTPATSALAPTALSLATTWPFLFLLMV